MLSKLSLFARATQLAIMNIRCNSGTSANQITTKLKKLADPQAWMNLMDPVVGTKMIKMAQTQVLARSDFRTPKEIYEGGGFAPRKTRQELLGVTVSQVQAYQSYNTNPFGLGACKGISSLARGYMQGNSTTAKQNHLYCFVSNAVYLPFFNLEVGAGKHERDYEEEHLVTDTIPLHNIYSSCAPEHLEKLLAGLRVPNEMAKYNSELPKSFSMEDMENSRSVLGWFLENNCEKAAQTFCAAKFGNLSEEDLSRKLGRDQPFLKIVQSLIQPNGAPGMTMA